jgi:hypothetical protein
LPRLDKLLQEHDIGEADHYAILQAQTLRPLDSRGQIAKLWTQAPAVCVAHVLWHSLTRSLPLSLLQLCKSYLAPLTEAAPSQAAPGLSPSDSGICLQSCP